MEVLEVTFEVRLFEIVVVLRYICTEEVDVHGRDHAEDPHKFADVHHESDACKYNPIEIRLNILLRLTLTFKILANFVNSRFH